MARDNIQQVIVNTNHLNCKFIKNKGLRHPKHHTITSG